MSRIRTALTVLKSAVLAPIPDREGDHDHEGETGRLAHASHRVPKIPMQGVQSRPVLRSPVPRLDLLGAAELHQRLTAGATGVHSVP